MRRSKKMTDTINATENNSEEVPNKELEKQEIIQVCSNRLVIVTGDKGGVGKSTFARGLVQTYLDKNKTFIGFDLECCLKFGWKSVSCCIRQ